MTVETETKVEIRRRSTTPHPDTVTRRVAATLRVAPKDRATTGLPTAVEIETPKRRLPGPTIATARTTTIDIHASRTTTRTVPRHETRPVSMTAVVTGIENETTKAPTETETETATETATDIVKGIDTSIPGSVRAIEVPLRSACGEWKWIEATTR